MVDNKIFNYFICWGAVKQKLVDGLLVGLRQTQAIRQKQRSMDRLIGILPRNLLLPLSSVLE